MGSYRGRPGFPARQLFLRHATGNPRGLPDVGRYVDVVSKCRRIDRVDRSTIIKTKAADGTGYYARSSAGPTVFTIPEYLLSDVKIKPNDLKA